MKHFHTKIAEADDAVFQALVDEIYHCVGWARDDSVFPTLFYLIQGIGAQDPKSLKLTNLPTPGILGTKVGKLPNGIVYDICLELAHSNRTHLDDGKSVLALLKLALPKPTPKRKLTRGQIRHEASNRMIIQRRKNGDL